MKSIDIMLLTRHEGENFEAWKKRFRVFMGYDPKDQDIAFAPFPMVKLPACTSQERFRWCMANVGMYKFHEVSTNFHNYGYTHKLWVFDDETDCVMFKLRWLNTREDTNYQFDPKDASSSY
jgi:hypothetical protein